MAIENIKKRHNPKANAPALYIPCWLSQVPTSLISNSAKMLYGRLAQWCDEKGDVYRSATQLALELGSTVRNIERYLKELRDLGLVGTFQPQAGGVNHFEFYDHEWMYEPLKEQLVYKNDTFNPPSNLSVPSVKSVGTPPSKVADINIKEIIINNKNIGASNESPELVYSEFDEQDEINAKSDKRGNQPESSNNDILATDLNIEPVKSDYCDSQTNKNTNSKSAKRFDLKDILSENIFQIPEDVIQDWLTTRAKKRAPVTKTAWMRITKELSRCKEWGIDPLDAFETMVASGWQSLKVEYFERQIASKAKGNDKSPQERAAEQARIIQREKEAALRKKEEIASSSRFKVVLNSFTTSMSFKERKEQQEKERIALGLSAAQYHERIMRAQV